MLNKEIWLASHEKLATHNKINPLILKWAKENPNGGNLVTMPANSGIQENYLMRKLSDNDNFHLHTVDWKLKRWETGVNYRYRKNCTHHIGDVWFFAAHIAKEKKPMAMWADLTGCLHEKNSHGWTTVTNQAKKGSLFFITLATGGKLRGWDKGSLWRGLVNTGLDPVDAADWILARNPALEEAMPVYTYRHGKTEYSVFGYRKE